MLTKLKTTLLNKDRRETTFFWTVALQSLFRDIQPNFDSVLFGWPAETFELAYKEIAPSYDGY